MVANGNILKAQVGGQVLVIAWDPVFESLNIWVNDTGAPVKQIDLFCKTPDGSLQRFADVKAGLFWHVWSEFFPHTDINRRPGAEA